MGFFGFGKKQRAGASAGAIAFQSSTAGLAGELEKVRISPTFVSAYVSPHVDIDQVARALTARFAGVPMMICSTAGELHAGADQLYRIGLRPTAICSFRTS